MWNLEIEKISKFAGIARYLHERKVLKCQVTNSQ